MSSTHVVRWHEISCGHRVHGHEGKCRNLHGHNYRVTFYCKPKNGNDLDAVGRVIDFSVVKALLCEWLESEWDHRFLMWCDDPGLRLLQSLDTTIVPVPFNPTAERMAEHLLYVVAPAQLEGTGVVCTRVDVQETSKCSANAWRRG